MNTKVTVIQVKIPDTTDFITIREFNRVTKINFAATMKKAPKNLASQVYNAHDKADGNREKKSENVRWLF